LSANENSAFIDGERSGADEINHVHFTSGSVGDAIPTILDIQVGVTRAAQGAIEMIPFIRSRKIDVPVVNGESNFTANGVVARQVPAEGELAVILKSSAVGEIDFDVGIRKPRMPPNCISPPEEGVPSVVGVCVRRRTPLLRFKVSALNCDQ